MANGTRLGWLIDPIDRQVHVYEPAGQVTSLSRPASIAGDSVLPGFVFNAEKLWD